MERLLKNLFYRGRIQLKINCANNKLTCEGGKVLLSSNFIFFLSCLSKLCSVSRSQWWADSINPDIPICFAALIRPIHFVIMSPILIMSMCRTEMFFSLIFYSIHINHLQMIMYEQSLDFCILFTLCHIIQWFNHFLVIWFGSSIPLIDILHERFANSKFPNFGGIVWLVWPSLANCL